MPKRIDTAYVEFLPDFSGFDNAVTREINTAMQHVERTVDRTATDVSQSFDEVERDIEQVFNEIAHSGQVDFSEVTRVAQRAASLVGESFQVGGEGAERAFAELQHSADHDMDQIAVHAAATAGKVGSSFSLMGLIGSSALFGVGAAATAGLGALTVMGLKSSATLEQVQISFNSLLGSAEEGQKVFKSLQQFAAVTPFEFPDVAAAAKRFLAFHDSVGLATTGLEDYLTTIGNVISVTGGGGDAFARISLAIGQIGSASKVTLDNLNQIADAIPGFSPIAAIAKSLGVSTGQAMEMVSAGAISAQQGVQALLEGMKKFPGAAGAMEMQSQTLLGVFSTFKDTVGQALAEAFAPAIPAIKDSLTQLTPILGEALKQIAPLLGGVISGLGPLIGSLVQALVPILTPFIKLVSDMLKSLQDSNALNDLSVAFGSIITALAPLFPVISKIAVTLAEALIPVVMALAPIIADLAQPIADILLALVPLLPPIGDLIAALLLLIEPLIKVIALWDKFMTAEALVPIVNLLVKAISGLAFGVAFLSNWIHSINWGNVGKDIMGVLSAIGNFFVGIWHFIQSIPGKFLAALKALPTVMARALDNMLTAIGTGIGFIIGAFLALPGLVINAIIHFPEDLAAFVTSMWVGLKKLWSDNIDGVVDFFVKLPGRLVAGLKLGWHVVSDFFSDAWKNLGTFAKNAVDDIISFFVNLPSRLSSFGGSVGSGILDWIKGRLNAVIKGVNDGIEKVDDALPGISLPRLPTLAQGGIAFGPAIIGENAATGPEAAIPLGDSRAMSTLIAAFEAAQGRGGSVTNSNNITVVVEIDGEQMNARIIRVIDDSNRALKHSVNRMHPAGR